jgi:putative DNA primase/helicase
MTHTAEVAYDTPEATLEAVRELAAADTKGFAAAMAGSGPLLDAAVRHYRADSAWLELLIEAARQAGVTTEMRAAVRTMLKARKRDAEKSAANGRGGLRSIGPNEAPPLVRLALGDDAPVPGEAIVPAGYQLTRNGISIDGPDGIATVAARPIVISGALVDQTSGMERLVLSWWDGLRWRKRVVDRVVAMNRTKITQEANFGLKFNSENAGANVRYLSAFEDANDLVTPRLTTTSHLGWQECPDESESTFLCGTTVLRPGGRGEASATATNILAPETWHPDALVFHAKSDGDTQIASAFSPVGSYEAWRDVITPLASYPVPLFALYASLAAPVLALTGAAPFLVDICGQTSQGKTTTLQAAASPWGNPDPTAASTLIGSWNNTGNYVGQVAQMLNGLPILLDDTSQGKPREIPQLIYLLANGRGRGRMKREGGTQEVGSWETITLSTGETPLVSYSQDGGTRGRVLTLWGSPFGTGADGKVVAQLKADLKTTYGHAGPRFVQYLLDHHEDWAHWRQAYRDAVAEYITNNDGSPVANRLAEHAAVIRLTAVLAHEIDLLPWDYTDPVEPLWPMLMQGASDADRATEALRLIHSWAVGHRTSFDGQFRKDRDGTDIVPLSVYGAWKDTCIAFSQGPIKDVLTEAGFPVDGILRTWGDRGWLELGKDKSGSTLTKAARVQGTVTRCFVVPMEAFAAVEATDSTEVEYRMGHFDG